MYSMIYMWQQDNRIASFPLFNSTSTDAPWNYWKAINHALILTADASISAHLIGQIENRYSIGIRTKRNRMWSIKTINRVKIIDICSIDFDLRLNTDDNTPLLHFALFHCQIFRYATHQNWYYFKSVYRFINHLKKYTDNKDNLWRFFLHIKIIILFISVSRSFYSCQHNGLPPSKHKAFRYISVSEPYIAV